VSGTFRGVTTDVSAAYQGANGDFLYYDTAGTLATDVDDRATRRRNNHFDQGSLDLTASWGRKVRWQAGAHGFIKHQGTPGPAIAGGETVNARLTTGRMLASLGASGARGLFDGQARAHVLYERVTFVNPEGELVGPFGPNVSEGEALAAGLSLRSRVRAPRQLFSFLGDARVEHRWPYNLLFPDKAGAPSTRVVGAVGVADDVRLASGRVAFTPALRLDGAWSRIAASSSIPVQEATSLFVSPRLTARAEATSWLALRGSAGRFVRFPTLLELFGDGAFILPRPLLAPESAWGGDFGFTVGLGGAWGRFVLEAAFFGRQVSDTIAFVVGGVAATAENLGETRMLGAEARLEAELFRFARVRFDYTFVDPIRVDSGNLLPGRSPHEAHLRLELRRAPFSIFYDLDYQDRAFRDPANAAYVPERVLHAIGAAFDRGDVLFTAEIRNLADLRTLEIPLGTAGRTTSIPLVDFFNYPLPGRAIYATLAVRH
jgi:outer membrane receptor protein involved in Fe transport